MTSEELIAAVEAIPNHYPGGYEWEWECELRDVFEKDSRFPRCPPYPNKTSEHDHELISRERVLELLRP